MRLSYRPRALSAHVEVVAIDGRPLVPSSGLAAPVAASSKVQIDYDSISLSAASKIRFRYRLEAFDNSWVYAGTLHQATYTNLPPGSYRFIVAATSDGNWNGPEGVWAFIIEPRFYQTKMFYAICGASGAAGLYAMWLLRLRRYRSEFAVILAERTRMSREIHDTLLQSLASVAVQLQAVVHELDSAPSNVRESLPRIRRRVERYVREAREAIIDLRSPLLRLQDLPAALRESARHIVGDSSTRLDFVINANGGSCSPAILEQLVRITQEAIRNAVRHGNASFARVELNGDRRSIVLRIVDDGCGFDVQDVAEPPDHCGIVGMRERTERVRGRFTIESTKGRGTTVEVVVPRIDPRFVVR
jgi:signal transduction histidine kinase